MMTAKILSRNPRNDNDQVNIIIGSEFEVPHASIVSSVLIGLDIPHSINIFSVHRTPVLLFDHIRKIESDDIKVIIACGTSSSALSGMIAAHTHIPVIGLPLTSNTKLNGIDALVTTLQTPRTVPVMSVGIDSYENAAYAAAQIIALTDKGCKKKLQQVRNKETKRIHQQNNRLSTIGALDYIKTLEKH